MDTPTLNRTRNSEPPEESSSHHHQQLQQQLQTPISTRLSLVERQCLTWSRIDLPETPYPFPTTATTTTTNTTTTRIPPPRSGAASVVVKGRLYVFGGYGGGTGRLDDFYSYDFKSGIWEEVEIVSDEKPGCRENNGVVISDDTSCKDIYLFGGYNGNSWLNDLWKFDIESKRWTCIQESSDVSDTASTTTTTTTTTTSNHPNDTATHHPSTVAAGGSATASRLSSSSSAALQVRGKVPSRRFGYVSVVHNNKLVLFGGFDGSRWLNDMYVFDFATKVWSEIQAKGTLPSVRSCPAWAKDDIHVYIQGGYDGVERKSDFFACDLNTYTWIQMPCYGTPPTPARYFHTCCLYGSKMYVYGGYSGTERLSDMYAYDFETNHWSEVDCTNGDTPSGRSSLVAQVYENCLYIFGGYNGTTVLNDFYKFRLKPIGLPPPALVNNFRSLVNNPELADTVFIVEGQEVYAHLAVLAVRSEYFRVMLHSGGMRESLLRRQEPEQQHYEPELEQDQQEQDQQEQDQQEQQSSSSSSSSPNNQSESGNPQQQQQQREEIQQQEPSSKDDEKMHSRKKDQPQVVTSTKSEERTQLSTNSGNHNHPPTVYNNNNNTGSSRSSHSRSRTSRSRSSNYDYNIRKGPIVLKDVSYVVFLKVLEFLYTDTISDITSLEIGIHLLIASERFLLDRLKALCEDLIRHDINFENAISIFIASHRHNAIGLKDIVLEYILNNLSHPMIQAGLVELKAEPDLLLEIIRRNTAVMIQAGVVGGSGSYRRGNSSSSNSRISSSASSIGNGNARFILGHQDGGAGVGNGGDDGIGIVVGTGTMAAASVGPHHPHHHHHNQQQLPRQQQQQQHPHPHQQQQQQIQQQPFHNQEYRPGQFGAGAGW